MSRAGDNETLSRVGPGSAMGGFMRQYWIPAVLSSELEADGDPLRLMLLCEKLIAFRDSSGSVGIMDHRCPHRCASLFFGRNEEDGIRCVYHGWKFDVDGNCLDMANVPPHQDFKHKVKAKAYKTHERNGMIWVYMGDQSDIPSLPEIEATLLPENQVLIRTAQRDCNWLQGLEGDIDTSHLSFLHLGAAQAGNVATDNDQQHVVAARAPEYIVAETEYGTKYASFRSTEGEADDIYWRLAHFVFPFWALPPNRPIDINIIGRAWVPLDDEHTMYYEFIHKDTRKRMRMDKDGKHLRGDGVDSEFLPNTTDWLGRWRLAANAGNDYLIDRAIQRNESYTGISNIHLQDQAVTESMGAITDRTKEHLSPSDEMITKTRRRILGAVRAFQNDGETPVVRDQPAIMQGVRSGSYVSPAGVDWMDAYDEHMRAVAKAAE
jgi:phthalate 4,5-dioxygenase oxygenase subunit